GGGVPRRAARAVGSRRGKRHAEPAGAHRRDRREQGVLTPLMRTLVSSGSPYEPKVGMSRAVRVGSIVTVAGTAPIGPDGRTVGKDDPEAQARRCLEIIATALERAGASLRHVVRTRILLTRIEDW